MDRDGNGDRAGTSTTGLGSRRRRGRQRRAAGQVEELPKAQRIASSLFLAGARGKDLPISITCLTRLLPPRPLSLDAGCAANLFRILLLLGNQPKRHRRCDEEHGAEPAECGALGAGAKRAEQGYGGAALREVALEVFGFATVAAISTAPTPVSVRLK